MWQASFYYFSLPVSIGLEPVRSYVYHYVVPSLKTLFESFEIYYYFINTHLRTKVSTAL